jgi:hypothetical protein
MHDERVNETMTLSLWSHDALTIVEIVVVRYDDTLIIQWVFVSDELCPPFGGDVQHDQ